MPGYGVFDPIERLCRRAACGPPKPCGCRPQEECPRPCGCRPQEECPRPCRRDTWARDACREIAFWPCWNSGEEMCRERPKPRCGRCGCAERLERQGRYVRCCVCGWIGVFEECFTVLCGLRSACDNLFWPERPGCPR